MMNQYMPLNGRGNRGGYGDRAGSHTGGHTGDRTPYRRPMNRTGAGGCPMGLCNQNMTRMGSRCGCGTNRGNGQQGECRRLPSENIPRCPDKQDAIPAVISTEKGRSCGCGGGRSTACTHLMEQIRAVDFALYETVLYLDVYPHSCDALETYRKLKAQSEALHAEYEATCAPMTAFGNKSDTSWDWMSKPFPWEYDAD